MAWICVVFFFSGFPALIYQLVWQRSLFTLYGVNVESVTIVVTAFMLGLGLGSLLGGALTRIRRAPLLMLFAVIELAIGTFGFLSLDLFHWLGARTLGAGALETGLLSFLMVLLPTVLMGATLPLLVAHLVRRSGNVGRSVGILYFVNTLGSATACFAVAAFLMAALGQTGAVRLAAALNVAVAAGAFAAFVRGRREVPAPAPTADASGGGSLRMPAALALVAITGYIALSYEILWFRVYSFVTGSIAAAFALLLGSYLFGIAFGSLCARRFCRGEGTAHLRALAGFVLVANLLGFLLVPAVANAVRIVPWWTTLPLVAVAAAALGAAFPLICHHGIRPDERAGSGTSYLYLANIVGSALGSLLTGFVLMDVWPIGRISVFLALLGIGLAAALLVPAGLRGRDLGTRLSVAGGAAGLALLAVGPLFDGVYEKLMWKGEYDPGTRFAHVVETRSGVITVSEDGRIFGGGIYDGAFSTDLVNDRNGIVRAFAIAAYHPAPRRVLVIGLSSGSWSQVIAHHPAIEKLVIVEINPGYLGLIARYPVVASLLENPRVELVIDDGRRWLQTTDERFDVVVSNTTFHWRAHATNLLSVEFHELVREHLAEGGVFFLNATASARVHRTSATVFPHAWRIANFMLAGDRPIPLDRERFRTVLADFAIDGRPVFDLSSEDHRRRLDEVLALVTRVRSSRTFDYSVEPRDSVLERTEGERLVTDDNMGTEWRR